MAMSHRSHRVGGHAHDEIIESEATAVHSPFGVSQVFCAALGVFFLVIGMIGLVRAGLDQLTRPAVDIMGMDATPLLSLIHVVVGIVALSGAVSRGGSRSVCMVLGAAFIALGIVAVAEPVREFGWSGANAAAYLIAGALAIVLAMLTPAYSVGEERVTRDTHYAM